MITKYIYKEKEYNNAWQVRQAISKEENLAFGEEPAEGKVEFWKELGVTYIEEPAPEPDLFILKQQKLREISRNAEEWRTDTAVVESSLGFTADSDNNAKDDVEGLLVKYAPEKEKATITFRDANNEFHQLTYDQLNTLHLEIIENGLYMYEQKWSMQAQVESAQSVDDIEAIDITFKSKDFSENGISEL